eukprot:TRINITY_DN29622_c0_g2_i1.p1 TRINITY_DN29622_c0_g2~~TRINITY_DN29622_c0_g2_i1.p1  ORF type:complete len:489 (-),score=37.41 TRINITY_DN29622_c0_g2_i1:310-1776(-)
MDYAVFQRQRCQNWKLPEHYEVRQLLAAGSVGTTAEAYDRHQERLVAVKRAKNVFDSRVECERLLREVAILNELSNTGVLKIFDIVPRPDMESADDLYIVLELCDSDLKKLCRTPAELEPIHIRNLVYNILVALKYIHSAGIIHCNLMPWKCLVNQDCSVKLSGFALSRVIEDSSCSHVHEVSSEEEPEVSCQTSRLRRHIRRVTGKNCYTPPELCLHHPVITVAVDMWFVGCILAELLQMLPGTAWDHRGPLFQGSASFHTRDIPAYTAFRHHTAIMATHLQSIFSTLGLPDKSDVDWLIDKDAKKYVSSFHVSAVQELGALFLDVEQSFVVLLKRMLKFNPEKRVNVDDALSHPMFGDLRESAKEAVAPCKIRIDTLSQPNRDSAYLRKQWQCEVAKHPLQEVAATLEFQKISSDAFECTCRAVSGDVLTVLEVPEMLSVAVLRTELADRSGIRLPCLKLIMPCGYLLTDADNTRNISDLIGSSAT